MFRYMLFGLKLEQLGVSKHPMGHRARVGDAGVQV